MTKFAKTIMAAFVGVSIAGGAQALEFRKCNIDAVISGVGLPATTIPGSEFVAWAREESGTRAAIRMNNISNDCLGYAVVADRGAVPSECQFNSLVHNSSRKGYGLTGFQLTRGFSAIKNLICNNPNIGKNYSRSRADAVFDKRIIDGFSVYWRKRGGTGACRGAPLTRTSTIQVVCHAPVDILRLDRFPLRMYRASSRAPASACKTAFSARGHGTNTQEARDQARDIWVQQITRIHGPGFADPRKWKASDYGCVRKLSGKLRGQCVLTATPCYF